jgi:Flp pilus assembly protein TadD
MRIVACALAVALVLAGGSTQASILQRGAKSAPTLNDAAFEEIQRAIDEQRLLDAGRYLDEAMLAGVKDPRLNLLDGDLALARGRFEAALAAFKDAEAAPATQAHALEGEGIALSLMGRSDEALKALQQATSADPLAWRAWNALGAEYDAREQWPLAEAAYEHAMAASDAAALVLNNRGYSRLLQHRRDAAVADFVAALRKKPDLTEARTNLRLALAMGGDYDRALSGGAPGDQAALLNNAGFAAAMRGDYAKADELLNRAVALKGEYYGRASENLKIVHALASRTDAGSNAAP